jgi:hypothetical protein
MGVLAVGAVTVMVTYAFLAWAVEVLNMLIRIAEGVATPQLNR